MPEPTQRVPQGRWASGPPSDVAELSKMFQAFIDANKGKPAGGSAPASEKGSPSSSASERILLPMPSAAAKAKVKECEKLLKTATDPAIRTLLEKELAEAKEVARASVPAASVHTSVCTARNKAAKALERALESKGH